jgi:hypothetical protein
MSHLITIQGLKLIDYRRLNPDSQKLTHITTFIVWPLTFTQSQFHGKLFFILQRIQVPTKLAISKHSNTTT